MVTQRVWPARTLLFLPKVRRPSGHDLWPFLGRGWGAVVVDVIIVNSTFDKFFSETLTQL
jgi:bifunctional DNase/RNase